MAERPNFNNNSVRRRAYKLYEKFLASKPTAPSRLWGVQLERRRREGEFIPNREMRRRS